MSETPKPNFGQDSVKDSARRRLENRSLFSGWSRSELEQFVSEYLSGDSKKRERVEDLIEEIRARSRRGVDRFTDLVRTEVRKEFGSFSPARREEIGEFFERLVGLVGEYFGPGRTAGAPAETTERRQAATAVKKAVKKAAKKVAAKKTAVRKVAAKKVAAKKAAAKKAPSKRASTRSPRQEAT